ncbi:tetratricopeptide repeat protein [Parasphingorhabdus sp. NYA22]
MDDAAALQLCLERDRLLSDAEFARSPSMCKLLRFLVDYKLSGNSVPLKSYTIATDALGRDADFDTQTDSYPRVQMGRLRRMLDNFYLRKGGENRLAIAPNKYEIILEPNVAPSGHEGHLIGQGTDSSAPDGKKSKRPEIEARPPVEKQTESQRGWYRGFLTILGVSILLVAIGIPAYLLWPAQVEDEIAYPRIALDLPDGASGVRASELSESVGNQLVRGLNGFSGLRIFDAKSGQPEKSDYVLRLRFLEATADKIELRLLDGQSGEILWSRELNTSNERAFRLELDQAIIALAGPYGEIAQTEISKLENDYSAGYPCLLQFDLYIRYREPRKLEPLKKCLEKSVERFPNDAHLLSVSAFARNMSERSNPGIGGKGAGMLLARQAEALDQNSAAANFAVAQSAFFAGDCATGLAWGKKAVALNPLNSRISGYLGLYMIGCDYPEGEKYAAQALELDPNADLAIAAAVALQMLKRGDAIAARELTTEYLASSPRKEPALELTYMLSSAMLNDKDEARRVWKTMATDYGLSENSPPREVLDQWIDSPTLINEIMTIMNRSGMFEK